MKLAVLSALLGSTAAFPALLNLSGKGKGALINLNGKDKILDLEMLDFNQENERNNTFPAADPKNCPYNKDHKPAAAWNPKFPYNHAKLGLPGKGKGGYQVPHPDDEDHKFIAPGPNDIRGP